MEEWKLGAWLLKRDWVDQSRFSEQEVERASEALRARFSDAWAAEIKNRDGRNVVFAALNYGESSWAHQTLVQLGLDLILLEHYRGFASVVSRLRSTDQSESADMEIAVAAVLTRHGYSVRLPLPKSRSKTPDIYAARSGEEVCIECKYLRRGEQQDWLDHYFFRLTNRLCELTSQSGWQIDCDLHFPAIDRSRKPRDAADHVFDEIKACLIAEGGLVGAPFSLFDVPAAATGTMVRATGFGTCIRYKDTDQDRHFRRVAQNGIARANEQIGASGFPGIAVIFSDKVLDSERARKSFKALVEAKPDDFRLLVAVLVFPPQVLGPYRRPVLLQNHLARVMFDDLPISRILRDLYGLQEPETV